MKHSKFNKPILSGDGTILLDRYTDARCQGYEQHMIPVRQVVDTWYDFIAGNTIRIFSGVSQWQPMTEAEWAYLSEGMRQPLTFEERVAGRAPLVGKWHVTGGFEEFSCVFRFTTSDEALAMRFRDAIQANPGWPAAKAWHDECDEEFAQWAERWPRLKQFRAEKAAEWEQRHAKA